jgi:hypothetical protein
VFAGGPRTIIRRRYVACNPARRNTSAPERTRTEHRATPKPDDTSQQGKPMYTVLKAGCLAIYALAVLGAHVALPLGIAPVLQTIAVVVVAVHGLELLVAMNSVRRYPGPLIDSIALTLLFGFAHWRPLAQRA